MELNRFEKANVKRVFNSTKSLRTRRAKVVKIITEKAKEVEAIDNEIKEWEQPVINKYGKTSEELLMEMDAPITEEVEANTEIETVYEEDVIPSQPAVAPMENTPWGE